MIDVVAPGPYVRLQAPDGSDLVCPSHKSNSPRRPWSIQPRCATRSTRSTLLGFTKSVHGEVAARLSLFVVQNRRRRSGSAGRRQAWMTFKADARQAQDPLHQTRAARGNFRTLALVNLLIPPRRLPLRSHHSRLSKDFHRTARPCGFVKAGSSTDYSSTKSPGRGLWQRRGKHPI